MSFLLTDPVIVVDVVTEPVTLDEAKAHMNMLFETAGAYEFGDDDNYITSLIPVAREVVEKFTGRSLAPKTLRVSIDNDDGDYILPYGPIVSVLSVSDSDGAVDAEDYKVQAGAVIKPSCSFVEVEYEAGYTTLPAGLKHAILEEISWRYHHRGEESDISKPARDLAKKYRVVTWLA